MCRTRSTKSVSRSEERSGIVVAYWPSWGQFAPVLIQLTLHVAIASSDRKTMSRFRTVRTLLLPRSWTT